MTRCSSFLQLGPTCVSFRQLINLCKPFSLINYIQSLQRVIPPVGLSLQSVVRARYRVAGYLSGGRGRGEGEGEGDTRGSKLKAIHRERELSTRVLFQWSNGVQSSPPSHGRKTSHDNKPEIFMLPIPGSLTEGISSRPPGGGSKPFHSNQDFTYVSSLLALFPLTDRTAVATYSVPL